MPIKFLNAIKKPIQKTIKIAGITLVMLMMAYGIELTNDTAVSLAADYYYVDVSAYNHPSGLAITVDDYSMRPEIWVNEGGKLKAKVIGLDDATDDPYNLIKCIAQGYNLRYATNAFVRDGDLRAGGDYVYFCGMDCGRISGIGTLHGKNVMFCPDWNNNYGHLMEKGEVYNGVTIQTTGRLFFGRDSELTDECLQQLAAAGVNVSAPTKLSTRLYSRSTIRYLNYDYFEGKPADADITKELYFRKDEAGLSWYDVDYPVSITADGYGQHDVTDDTDMVPLQDYAEAWKEVPAEEGLRCDDADFMRVSFQGNVGFEIEGQFEGGAREYNHQAHGLQYVGHTHK